MLASQLLPPFLTVDQTEGGSESRSDHRSELHLHLGYAGKCDGRQHLFILVFDDSGSVIGEGGADVRDLRYAEARLAIRTLARACRCGKEQVAVLHFDNGPGNIVPTALDGSGLGKVFDALEPPDDGGSSSELLPVLRRARDLVAPSLWRRRRNQIVHLIVASDYALLDDREDKAFQQLANFPATVTAVVLGERVNDRLRVPTVNVVQVDPDAEPGVLARALFGRLTTSRWGRRLDGDHHGR